MKKLALLLLLLLPLLTQAQYGNIWCFGRNCGMDFNNGSPQQFGPTGMNTIEGCASVCDSTGQLLFYSNGENCWNRNNDTMPNGAGLLGNESSTQAALALPMPGSNHLYYLFVTEGSAFSIPSGGLYYNIVDMNLNGGLGDITIKNQLMNTPICEKLAATRHCNGNDWWIVCHEEGTAKFCSFLLNNSGVSPTPILSNIGFTPVISSIWGQMKISPNGKYIASANNNATSNNIELFEFDNSTGQINNQLLIDGVISGFNFQNYGIAFSPDSKKLYADYLLQNTTTYLIDSSSIVQYDISSNDSSQIRLSRFALIGTGGFEQFGSFQLAPDRKIYAVGFHLFIDTMYHWSGAIYAIGNPDNSGANVSYNIVPNINCVDSPLYFGLPNYYDGVFTNRHIAYLRVPTCNGVYDSIPFIDTVLATTHEYYWNFGDTASGSNNTYNGATPAHSYSNGTYMVTLNLVTPCDSFTVTIPVTVTQANPATIPIITLVSTDLQSSSAISYQWYLDSTLIVGATNQFYTPITNGNYTVVITDSAGCSQTSAIFNLTSVDIQWLQKKNTLSLYPNPVKETLSIPSDIKYYRLIIKDITGRVVSTLDSYHNIINVSQLDAGIYFINVLIDNIWFSTKFVKE